MIKAHCVVCDKYRKFKNTKISNVFKKILGLPIACCNCGNE